MKRCSVSCYQGTVCDTAEETQKEATSSTKVDETGLKPEKVKVEPLIQTHATTYWGLKSFRKLPSSKSVFAKVTRSPVAPGCWRRRPRWWQWLQSWWRPGNIPRGWHTRMAHYEWCMRMAVLRMLVPLKLYNELKNFSTVYQYTFQNYLAFMNIYIYTYICIIKAYQKLQPWISLMAFTASCLSSTNLLCFMNFNLSVTFTGSTLRPSGVQDGFGQFRSPEQPPVTASFRWFVSLIFGTKLQLFGIQKQQQLESRCKALQYQLAVINGSSDRFASDLKLNFTVASSLTITKTSSSLIGASHGHYPWFCVTFWLFSCP